MRLLVLVLACAVPAFAADPELRAKPRPRPKPVVRKTAPRRAPAARLEARPATPPAPSASAPPPAPVAPAPKPSPRLELAGVWSFRIANDAHTATGTLTIREHAANGKLSGVMLWDRGEPAPMEGRIAGQNVTMTVRYPGLDTYYMNGALMDAEGREIAGTLTWSSSYSAQVTFTR